VFELRVKIDFPAAHHLTGYPGDCARPHGHNWTVEVFARSKRIDSIGMAMDFRDLKVALKEIIAGWDHQDLNTLPEFKELNPSAEVLAQIVFQRLSPMISHSQKETWIDRVTIWENDRCSATYFEDDRENVRS